MRVRLVERGPLRRIVRRYLLALLGAVTLLLYAYWVLGPPGYMAWSRRDREERALLQEIRTLKREKKRLAERIKALRDDPKAIEGLARQDLGYVRKGEVVYKRFQAPGP